MAMIDGREMNARVAGRGGGGWSLFVCGKWTKRMHV